MKYLTRSYWMEFAKKYKFFLSSTLFVAFLLIILGQLLYFQTQLVERASLEQAEQYAAVIEQVQQLYSDEIAVPGHAMGVTFSHDFVELDNALPSPATFNVLLGERLKAIDASSAIRLYNAQAFPNSINGGPRDEFESAALAALIETPSERYYQFETVDELRVLRYAAPRYMTESCIACHNTLPESQKTDWQVGEMHGVLSISLPIEAAWAQAQSGMLNITITVVTLAAGLAGLLIWGLQRSRRMRNTMEKRVYERTAALTAANLQLERGIGERESAEKRLSAVLDTVGEGIITIDPTCDIIMVNREANAIWGYNPGELMAEPLTRLVASALEPIQAFMEKAVADEAKSEMLEERIELVGLHKTGHTFPVELRIARTAIDEQRLFTLAARDITQRKQMENDLRQERKMLAERVEERTLELRQANQQLENASRMKDEFLASMSHELRTPLNAILGLSEAMREEIYGNLDKRMRRPLTLIGESGHHLLDLINDILDVSKIEAGQLQLHKSTVAVQTVCEASLSMVRQVAEQKNIRLRFEMDPRARLMQADELRLKQALVNLLSNAVKFTPDGGAVGMQVRCDEFNQRLYFVVVDTGIGIAEEDQERLFDPFVQVDSSLSRRFSGTGLGLALVKRLITLHGGSITVESKVGTGSRFVVMMPWETDKGDTIQTDKRPSLPSIDEAPEEVMPSETLVLEGYRPHILLAEDNAVNVATVLDFLEYKGLSVTVAHDGIEACELAKQQPSLILMDIQMPRMDGLEATRRIRTEPATADIPIIALTGLAMSGDRERCLEAGADDYLSKPFQLNELIEMIETQLAKKALLPVPSSSLN